LALIALGLPDAAFAQVALPQVVVRAPKQKPKPRPVHVRAVPAPMKPAASSDQVVTRSNSLDRGRDTIYAPLGTAPTTISHDTIEALPQGTNATVEKIVLQAPGVSQDSGASGNFHVRNEHANVQVRINGIMLPDGVSGFGTFLDTALIGNMSLVTGALPAQYGLRTSGVLDITTRSDAFNNFGSAGVYGGSRGTFTPSFEYGGSAGQTEYFLSGRFLQNDNGLENPTSKFSSIHDHTEQERGFGYVSTFIDDYTRVSLIAGAAVNKFQIPDSPGQTPDPNTLSVLGIADFDSSLLNENQIERNYFGVAALQRSVNGADVQLSYFSRYSSVHFVPDPLGDLVFNDTASDVYRSSFANGIAGDASYLVNGAHTLRGGFILRTEKTQVTNTDTLFPIGDDGSFGAPFTVVDANALLGFSAGAYVSDEWRLTDWLTLSSGLRFDQYWQYVSENQFSPRVSLTWKPSDITTIHAGYARTLTPPEQVLAAPTNLALVTGTTLEPSVTQNDPVKAERADIYDVGVVEQVLPGLEMGIDGYYKCATNLIDDGQFGQAFVLTAFNYAKAQNVGVELSAKYRRGNFQAYANLAWAQQIATDPVSNQFLFDNATPLADLGGSTEYQYLQTHWVNTDHAQTWTGSAGASYEFCGRPATAAELFGAWCGTRLSADMIYGSGLRDGDANISAVAPYSQFNIGLAREFLLSNDLKPVTVRFDVVNVADSTYLIRDGSGIGVFAPQYGPRRGYFVGVSKKF
jgi:outer membrane receptor protein involved in Fe transport